MLSEADPWLRAHPAQLEWLQGTGGVEVAEDSDIFQTVAGAIQSVSKASRPASSPCTPAARSARPFTSKAFRAVGFGPLSGDNTQSGGTDEWVSADDFINMVEVVANIVVDWCG